MNDKDSRQTLKDFLSTIGFSGKDRIDYVRETGNDHDGLGIDPNTNKHLLDLTTPHGILGDYLSYIIEHSDSVLE